MSDDKALFIALTAVTLGFFMMCADGCREHEMTQRLKATGPTVVTCIEHSVFDRVQVVQ